MQNKLKGWIVPNSVTKDPNDKILILDAAGNVGAQFKTSVGFLPSAKNCTYAI